MMPEIWSLNMSNIVFIGSNPSIKSSKLTPFWNDTKSAKILRSWLEQLKDSDSELFFYNVSDKPTENNRPLKMSEIKENLQSLKNKLAIFSEHKMEIKVIALGKTAEKALTLLRIPHYTMPHPSPVNRQLNNQQFIDSKINGLIKYLQT
jgi:uracil-DNA glycosylase